MKKSVKTFEEFIGDLVKKHKVNTDDEDREIFSPNTNEPGRHYDQEDDGSDQINRSVIQRYSAAEK
jgi:hypothetical protein